MRLILLTLLSFCCSLLPAQSGQVWQVVTKTIEEDYAYRDGHEVAVEGEKAEIFIETWSRPTINIRLELTAKHASLDVARDDLDNLTFTAEKVKNKIYLRNSRRDKQRKARAVLTIHYYITLPEDCPVYLKNYFGAANISNLRNRLRIFGEYSQINIDNVEGLLDIRTRFGDILGEKIDGNVTINARRSDITLQDIAGSYTINAQYGVLRLAPNAGLRDLQINAEKSEVHLTDLNGRPFAYQLTTTHGRMQLPPGVRTIDLESTAEVKRVQIRPARENAALITVSVNFGDLYLESQDKRIRDSRF